MELATEEGEPTVCAIFMQDPEMVAAFHWFPEVLLMEPTPKTCHYTHFSVQMEMGNVK